MGIGGIIRISHRSTELPNVVRSTIKGGVIFTAEIPPHSLIEGVIVRDYMNCRFHRKAQP